jgi:hypothetical protein
MVRWAAVASRPRALVLFVSRNRKRDWHPSFVRRVLHSPSTTPSSLVGTRWRAPTYEIFALVGMRHPRILEITNRAFPDGSSGMVGNNSQV